jgi:hypothetical protein
VKWKEISPLKEVCLIALLISGSLISSAQEPQERKITIPMTAKDAKGFAPDGWTVQVVKNGDLNGDGIDDAAIVIMKPEVMENDELKEVTKRFLVLAFGEGDQLKRTALSDEAIWDGDYMRGADAFSELSVDKGLVNIEHFGGATLRRGYTHCYEWRQNRWMLIGRTYNAFNVVLPDEENERIDTDLSTGFVTRIEPENIEYYELQAVTTSEAQKIDGHLEPGEWQGYFLKLDAKRHVVKGVQFWKGKADVSATLNAVRQGEDLFIRAEVADDKFSEGDGLRLANGKGRLIAPKEIKTAPAPKGYNVEARYSMKDLAKLAPEDEYAGDSLERFWGDDAFMADVAFSAAVEIIDVDGAARRATLSTRLSGGRSNASIRVYQEGIAVLENKSELQIRDRNQF